MGSSDQSWVKSKQVKHREGRGEVSPTHLVFIIVRRRFKQGPLLWKFLADWLAEGIQLLRLTHTQLDYSVIKRENGRDKERGCG